MNESRLHLLREYALSFVGVPYKWGGNNPIEGLDCSGLVRLLLRSEGVIAFKPDLTSQNIHDYLVFAKAEECLKPRGGAVAFFGVDRGHITHVALCLDEHSMIEAHGGDHTTLTKEDAAAKNAFVEVTPITHRKDLLVILMPNYEGG